MRNFLWIVLFFVLAGCAQTPPADPHEGHDHPEGEHDHALLRERADA